MAALGLTERELLEAVVREPDDEAALGVLADYWLEHGEEARGEYLHLQLGERGARIDLAPEEARLGGEARRWREPLLRAGLDERDLALDRGFLQRPPVVQAGDPLDGDPDLVRLSPRYYRWLRTLYRGSFLDVLAAEAVTPLRTERVAIKVARSFQHVPILEREHAILGRLHHPNVSRDLGLAIRPEGAALVLAWAGASLDGILDATRRHQRPLGVAFAISVACQLCDALAATHTAGVVHREIRSDHVLVAADGTATLIDFGYVRAAEPIWPNAEYGYGPGGVSPGVIPMGRVSYLSPEQAMGEEADERADLYSAAILACELVGGLHPVYGRTGMEALVAIRDGNLQLPRLPPPLADVIRRALARRRSARHGSARELGDALAAAAAASSIEIGPHVIAQVLCELGVPA